MFLAGVLCFFLLAPQVFAVTGFVDSPLWISPASPKEGDTVTLSAVFHNDEPEGISGSILFYDGETLLDEKPVTLRADEVATVTTSFTITAGSHLFSASTKNLAQVSNTGTLQVLTVSQPTVKLPLEFVPKTIVVSGQAGDDISGDPEAVILQQVDKVQSSVLASVPPATKKEISGTANSIDNWRSSQAESFTKSRDGAKTALDTKNAPVSAKKGSVKGTSVSAGPFTYIKYMFDSLMSFLFSSALVFYLAVLLIIYLILRFILRRLRGSGKKKSAPRPVDSASPRR